MSTLYLPDGVRVAVWRLVKARLRADATLAQPPVRLIFFEGTRDATESIGDEPGPAIIFLASMGPLAWNTEREMVGALIVDYQVKVPGTDDEDVLNLQEAIEAALYPDGDDFRQSLIDAGAQTGQPEFTRPMALPQSAAGRAGMFVPTGQFVVRTLRPFPA
jgi:hypothetical protein